jgi:hypothetical protein
MARVANIRGTTLVESLVSLLLGTVMITGLYGFYRSELFHHLSQEAKTATLEDARGGLDIMVRDLKNAGSWGTGSVPPESGNDDPDGDTDSICNRVYAATATMIHVQMDLNGNGNCNDVEPRESLRYELTGPTSTCPGSKIMRRNGGDCLIANVATVTDGKLFHYYDSAGALGDTPALQAISECRLHCGAVEDPDPARGWKRSSRCPPAWVL